MLEEVLRLQCPIGSDIPKFRLEKDVFERLDSVALKNGLLNSSVNYNVIKGVVK